MEKFVDLGNLYSCRADEKSVSEALSMMRYGSVWSRVSKRELAKRILLSKNAQVQFLKGVPLGVVWFEVDGNGAVSVFNFTTTLVDVSKVGYVRLFGAGAPKYMAELAKTYSRAEICVPCDSNTTKRLYLEYIPASRVLGVRNGMFVIEVDLTEYANA